MPNAPDESFHDGTVNNDKPRLWLALAWLLVIAAFVAGILGLLTIGKFILPFAFVGLYLVLRWGGDRKRALVSTPSVHPLDLPIEYRARKPVAWGAALWTILGVVVASNGLSAVDSKARPYIVAIIVIAAFDGIAATLFALQGKRRRAILALFVSIIFPTYFFWAMSLIPIALAGYLLFSPFIAQLRDPEVKRRNTKLRRNQDD